MSARFRTSDLKCTIAILWPIIISPLRPSCVPLKKNERSFSAGAELTPASGRQHSEQTVKNTPVMSSTLQAWYSDSVSVLAHVRIVQCLIRHQKRKRHARRHFAQWVRCILLISPSSSLSQCETRRRLPVLRENSAEPAGQGAPSPAASPCCAPLSFHLKNLTDTASSLQQYWAAFSDTCIKRWLTQVKSFFFFSYVPQFRSKINTM